MGSRGSGGGSFGSSVVGHEKEERAIGLKLFDS